MTNQLTVKESVNKRQWLLFDLQWKMGPVLVSPCTMRASQHCNLLYIHAVKTTNTLTPATTSDCIKTSFIQAQPASRRAVSVNLTYHETDRQTDRQTDRECTRLTVVTMSLFFSSRLADISTFSNSFIIAMHLSTSYEQHTSNS